MSFNIPANVALIANAILGVLGPGLASQAEYATAEAEKYAKAVDTIGDLYRRGVIDADEVAQQLDIQKSANLVVLEGIQGVNDLMAAEAINAGVSAVAGLVNTALGLHILPV